MFTLSRREFLKGSALLAAAAAGVDLSTSVSDAAQTQPTPAGNGDRLNVAVIGIRGRGRDHIRGFAGRHGCVVTHLCDCDTASVPQATITQTASAQGGQRPTFVRDLRRIMDDRNIQIVSIATPNHWHSLAAIWAIQAGKDVYVEKPVSHNVSEGRRVVQFARHHNKICQAGTQIRSSTGVRQAIEWLRAGNLGQVNVARGLCYKPRNSIGTTQGAQAIPSTI